MRRLPANLALAAFVLAVGFAFLEGASRVLVPISPGTQFLDVAGKRIDLHANSDGRMQIAPGATFEQVSADYRAWARIAPEGYRGPVAAGAPEIIFVGDSFTFGQGLTDEETFAARYCAAARRVCVNLGHPGTGTYDQVRILEYFLERFEWRPRDVRLFLLVASSLASGNDFLDTVRERAKPAPAPDAVPAALSRPSAGWMARLWEGRQWVLANSNLARIAYQHAGPFLRSRLPNAVTDDQMEAGIDAVAVELRRLDELAARYGFTYTIYALHPMQEILRGTYDRTLVALRRAAGDRPVIETAGALADDPRAYYFPYDGHLNPLGAERVAALLLTNERR